MAVDVDRHCYDGVFPYNVFLFLAFSLLCGKFSGLICLICGFAPQSAAMVMLGSFLLLWDLSPTWSFVSPVQYEQVSVEEIGVWLGALCTFFQFYRFFAPLRLHRDIMISKMCSTI